MAKVLCKKRKLILKMRQVFILILFAYGIVEA